jgi:uncharacterized protein YlxW (UPF0749 family)
VGATTVDLIGRVPVLLKGVLVSMDDSRLSFKHKLPGKRNYVVSDFDLPDVVYVRGSEGEEAELFVNTR